MSQNFKITLLIGDFASCCGEFAGGELELQEGKRIHSEVCCPTGVSTRPVGGGGLYRDQYNQCVHPLAQTTILCLKLWG